MFAAFSSRSGGGNGTIDAHCLDAEERIPKYLARWNRGAGTRAASALDEVNPPVREADFADSVLRDR